ncbi:restriction endonuclease subunit M [Campylobacter sp. MIT 99-7217]|uniref:DNA methyltransferase n=1 Tax=Campylobacter sp. MIT 99-7217 TaxID=535091 RepID=UPI001158423B|nr:DNA methyltransferase [Campylobacter sp. MIT 99-7217]TQR33765.1 restriction endonuclease subunit M [Campylobacter sp. MIT 99-7217]
MQDDLFEENELLTPKQSALWASEYLNKNVTSSNIIYLINYGKIANYAIDKKQNLVNKNELKNYYDSLYTNENLAHPLSFSQYKEAETTKHIHRLHPYKGKFIPQLVEYFLDSHTDNLKKEVFFKKGDIVLDIFCGSGTTLSVANELGMHAIGLEISQFNTLISNAKIENYELNLLEASLLKLNKILESNIKNSNILEFENTLNLALSEFNQKYFPREFKRQVALKQINEKTYSKEKEQEFLLIYEKIVSDFNINIYTNINGNFFEKWYFDFIKSEIMLLKNEIEKEPKFLQNILRLILSRTARSCRATTHADLATLKEPMIKSYYCAKHGRICKPLFSIHKWFKSYAQDTLKRLYEFKNLRSDTMQLCLNADATNCDIIAELKKQNSYDLANLVESKKIAGIFSSPPYVGLIDYHEQHAYAYDIFNFPRLDKLEIGSKSAGQSNNAKQNYVKNIAKALNNAKRFLKDDYNIFLVANDKFKLYPQIALEANMCIVGQFERPVLNRSEKDKNKYSEIIFHLKDAKGV